MAKRSTAKRAPRTDPLGPPAVRQHAPGGPNATMAARWRDPDDDKPSAARHAREVSGHRAFCPLRWLLRRSSALVTERHVGAADLLRWNFDVGRIGLSSARDSTPVNMLRYGPVQGPSALSLKQIRAAADFNRAMRIFTPQQQEMIGSIVLDCATVAQWCANQRAKGVAVNPTVEMGRLSACLDLLAEHLGTELDEALARGNVVV